MFTQDFINEMSAIMSSGKLELLDIFKMFLDRKALTDKDFAPLYAKENKSIDNCWKYITLQISKKKNKDSKGYCANIFELLDIAFHYYCEDSIDDELKEKEQPKVQVASSHSSSFAYPYSKPKKADKPCDGQLTLFDL
ncbi:MAG: PcfK-like family protein [Paludibacteraceae bacterium]|nr:PcfK-like family protein [Paludibacteraceae bacterium]